MIWLINSLVAALDRLERRSKLAAFLVLVAVLAFAMLVVAYLNADRVPAGHAV
ncbi:hypothetical protein [Burkholderia cenocepacia]|uniref:hypothetical protein n=1 Tax=Burkholderia cenocepacia TaxID=95486 RepID=UPI0022370DC4|nr:hypothetical protein [Burkholderia cenocepacia]MCW5141087.1 hypothetical protein [Burkholderia cenocepacia]